MARPSLTVVLNLHKLRGLKPALEADLRLAANGPVRNALQQWGALLGRFLTNRWRTFSFGLGNWKSLKPATLLRKLRKGQLLLILRATDKMFESFAPELVKKPGKVTQEVPFGMRVGFGGGMQYPHDRGGPTMAQIARWHQTGAGHLPARKIIVGPDQETINEMRAVMKAAVAEVAGAE